MTQIIISSLVLLAVIIIVKAVGRLYRKMCDEANYE